MWARSYIQIWGQPYIKSCSTSKIILGQTHFSLNVGSSLHTQMSVWPRSGNNHIAIKGLRSQFCKLPCYTAACHVWFLLFLIIKFLIFLAKDWRSILCAGHSLIDEMYVRDCDTTNTYFRYKLVKPTSNLRSCSHYAIWYHVCCDYLDEAVSIQGRAHIADVGSSPLILRSHYKNLWVWPHDPTSNMSVKTRPCWIDR